MKTVPDKINLRFEEPFYRGSVQNLYGVPGHDDLLVSETTSGGSVFDVGTIFTIEGSDTGRAAFRHLVFQQLHKPESWSALSAVLKNSRIFQKDESSIVEKVYSEFCNKGALTHHLGMIERESGKVYPVGFPSKLSNLTLIRKFEVIRPALKTVLDAHFYDYTAYREKDKNVIPLEYIVRLGVTSGSSILRKYNKLSETDRSAYLKELAVELLKPWSRFDPPIVDLTTKYEPEDRNLSLQEAALVSSIDVDLFIQSIAMAALGAYLLEHIFSKMGLSLWDLKWEIARDGNDLLFVDTIDTDSVRVTYNMTRNNRSYFVHFNKQAMRDYYRILHAEWYAAVNDAKKKAASTGPPFTEILKEGQVKGNYPSNPVIDAGFLDIQKEKFRMIEDFILKPDSDLTAQAVRIAEEELKFYEEVGKIAEYEALNSVA